MRADSSVSSSLPMSEVYTPIKYRQQILTVF